MGESTSAPVVATSPAVTDGNRPLSGSVVIATVATSAAAMVVGTINIGRSFNYDEGITYAMFVSGGSPWKALTTQFVFNNHQAFSAIQAAAWRIGLVGETSQRLLPVMCGVVAVGALTWWVGRRTDAIAGAFAGSILLANPVFVDEFRTLRGYALATLAVLVAAIATERSWRDERRRWLVGATIAMVVAATTHAYSVLPIVLIVVITAMLGHVRVAHLIAWLVAAISALIVQLPILDDARHNSAARGSRYRPRFGRSLVEMLLGGQRVVIVITTALAAVGLWALGRRSRRVARALAASIGLVAAVVLLLWQVVEPADLYPRFFVAMVPYLAALAAFGLHTVPVRLGAGVGALVVALLVPNVREVVDRTPRIREAATLVEAARADGRVVCGANPVPLSVYTTPVREIDPTVLEGPAGYDDCEVFVAVIGLDEASRAVAAQRFAHRIDFGGGILVFSDTPVSALVP